MSKKISGVEVEERDKVVPVPVILFDSSLCSLTSKADDTPLMFTPDCDRNKEKVILFMERTVPVGRW